MTTLIWPRSGTLQTTENLSGQCPRVCVKLKSGTLNLKWHSKAGETYKNKIPRIRYMLHSVNIETMFLQIKPYNKYLETKLNQNFGSK